MVLIIYEAVYYIFPSLVSITVMLITVHHTLLSNLRHSDTMLPPQTRAASSLMAFRHAAKAHLFQLSFQ